MPEDPPPGYDPSSPDHKSRYHSVGPLVGLACFVVALIAALVVYH